MVQIKLSTARYLLNLHARLMLQPTVSRQILGNSSPDERRRVQDELYRATHGRTMTPKEEMQDADAFREL